MVNLQSQGSGILLMRKVAPISGMAPISGLAPTSMGGMHTNLPVPSLLKVDKWSSHWDPIDSAWFGPEPTIVERQTH